MSVRVAVDFGTSSTCVVLSVDGRDPQVVVVDGQPLVPSAVFAAVDGTLFVGREAERQAGIDPSRYEPHPKRRIDEGELLLGSTVLSVLDVVHEVLTRAVGEARRLADGATVDLLVLTHPADWGAIRTRVLRQAAHGLGREFILIEEPAAAAMFHADTPDGAAGAAGPLAVLDLGGGTVDASVVRRRGKGFEVLANKGIGDFGGADIDQALLEHLGNEVGSHDRAAWQQLVAGRELADRRRRRMLHQDVRGAKETLSRHTFTDVPMPSPFPDAHVTRADLEGLIQPAVTRAVDLVTATTEAAGLTVAELTGVFLVGGSSRIPLVARLVHERIGLVPTTLDQPETVVARGALLAAALDPEHTSGLPGPAPGPGSRGRPPVGPPPGGRRIGGPIARPPAPAGMSGTPYRENRAAPTPPRPTAGLPPSFAPQGTPPSGGPIAPAASVGAGRGTAASSPDRLRRWALPVGSGVILLAAVISAVLFFGRTSDPGNAIADIGVDSDGQEIAQYDYHFWMPSDWEQTGGDASRRSVQVRPVNAQSETELIVVEEWRLNYDSDSDWERALGEVRQNFEAATSSVSDFDEAAEFAGREVIHYRQTLSDAEVDWYVYFDGEVQVNVGCQYAEDGETTVRRACEQVVGSLTVTG
ncbi:type VII secretion-associated protein [Actinoalloteichus hymeniacidonis]|uniref:Type VII secretion-associated protein n=1 Tax=Actinoalloteichus hymeniacidonis TaxID=340345 RepID=A0AAC9HUG8_9PSEU|nr:type VII secretion-associated protein [Actinoalloteichus hymeniacidonis]AOS65767.1 type VII secretion-associated protein [Actinoalloteichus hymeniacidonis]MBB5906143.1 type VII secretion-associated protein (TIGR03931 family) [Actinoalloteichus hymeniacidonis]